MTPSKAGEPGDQDAQMPGEVREPETTYPAAPKEERFTEAVLEQVVARIVETADPDRIILFGSAARGESGSSSDIDLLVIKSGVEHRGRLEEDIHMNLFGVGVAVDVVVVTPDDVERLKSGVGSVIGPALAEGVEVYVAPST